MLTSLERSCSDPYWHLLGEKYPCCRYSKLVVLTSTCPYNVKLHCKTLPCLGKWVRYPRVSKSVPLFRLAFLQHQLCLWWGDLSTTLPPLMHSSHMYHARDGHQQWWDVLVCLEGALTWSDLLIPNTISLAQSKAFWHVFWPLALVCFEERKGFVPECGSSYSLSEPGIEGVSFSHVLAKRGHHCGRSSMTLKEIAAEAQSLKSKELYYSRCSSYLHTFLKQHILYCCTSSERW